MIFVLAEVARSIRSVAESLSNTKAVVRFLKDNSTQIIAVILTAALYFFSFPINQKAEAAYFFAVPVLVWGYYCDSKKKIVLGSFLAAFLGWFALLIWLRHVTLVGTVALSGVCAIYLGLWFVVAAYVLKQVVSKGKFTRLFYLLGLASFWVVLEWLRGILLTGFPWLPLAASQWERPVMLQLAPWTGSWGISFVLIFINLVIAVFAIEVFRRFRREACPFEGNTSWRLEFYVGLVLFVSTVLLFVYSLPVKENKEFLFKVGVVQPNVPGDEKWDPESFTKNFQTLSDLTYSVAKESPDLILWPESALPLDFVNNIGVRSWVENMARETNVSLYVGGLAVKDEEWYCACLRVDPQQGLFEDFYAKQKRVPFGEYVPLRGFLPFVNKFVPASFDLAPGGNPLLLSFTTAADKTYLIGPLICYEDAFPALARKSAQAGADVFFLLTNNGWYGEEEAAYQHASHSVLRAVETRRPVVRCGNGGWSGWVDEYGVIRDVVLNEKKTIYFEGTGTFNVYRDNAWVGRETFFVKYGSWFPLLCSIIVLLLVLDLYRSERREIED